MDPKTSTGEEVHFPRSKLQRMKKDELLLFLTEEEKKSRNGLKKRSFYT